jgi:hypothetical protein
MAVTISMRANIGVNAGYFHQNGSQPDFYSLLQQTAGEIYRETGVYVSCLAYPAKAIYHTDWGCPAGGENTYNIESVANPEFAPDVQAWKSAALKLMQAMKVKLKQSTATVQFQESDLEYLK